MFYLTNRNIRGTVYLCWLGRVCCVLMLSPLSLCAKEYAVKQIAQKTMLNREPVISETGLVAWYAYEKNKDRTSANIYIYRDGEAINLTEGNQTSGLHPYVQGDTVVWEGGISKEIKIETPIAQATPVPETESPVTNSSSDVAKLSGSLRTVSKIERRQGWGICRWSGGEVKPVSFSLKDDKDLTASKSRSITNGGDQAENTLTNGLIRRGTGESTGPLSVISPVCWGEITVWQKASPWPCGWEISFAKDGESQQLTTNCYYDMGPQLYGNELVWYAWDGQDFEIMLYDFQTEVITQITDNIYDDVSPVIWDGVIAWEAYPSVEADIFIYKDGRVSKISHNIEDDVNPRIWNGQVVWQGLQEDDYEIFLYDGESTHQITDNNYDDIEPDLRDNLMCWVGYVGNWDAEIILQELDETTPTILSENNYEDHHPRTAKGIVVWEAKRENMPLIYIAEPR